MDAPPCDGEAHQLHEAKCLRCGRCCYAKLLVEMPDGDRIVYTDVPCGYLDVETMLCTIYERRHEVNPDCLGVEAGTARGVFPADCPYVKDIRGYRAPVTDLPPGELADFLDAIEVEEVAS